MRTPTSKGQYRRVRYTDDGCDIYQCLWCLGTIEIRDDPHYGWNFCPKCGKSWFKRLECRDHAVPRWYYNRWGNGGPDAPELWKFYRRPEPTATWVIEWRSKWPSKQWSSWQVESEKEKTLAPDWQFVRAMLASYRARHDSNDCIEFEYRAKLVRKNNLTFVLPDVESNIVRDLYTREKP